MTSEENERNEMRRQITVVLTAIGLTLAVVAPAAAAGADIQTANVNWHAQQTAVDSTRTGQVAGANAQIVRTDNGISYRLSTSNLTPGNAYTLWVVVINDASICAADPCTAGEIFNAASRSQVRFGAGHVAGSSGRGTFSGRVSVGPLSGWLPDRSLEDARAADVHLVINDHGPALPEFMPGMIHTYRGGCADRPTSPFPMIFPATALADGEVGPNSCRLFQAATFRP